MVMTRPPAFHIRKFLMKNVIPTNSGLNNYKHLLFCYKPLRMQSENCSIALSAPRVDYVT